MSTFNLADLFEEIVDVVPDRIAICCGAQRVSYSTLEERANRLASRLKAKGVGPGDHVGLHMFNSVEYLESIVALLKLRAVPININYRYVAHELAYLFENADLVGVIHEAEFADLVADGRKGLDGLTFTLARGADYEAEIVQGSAERDFGPRSGEDLYIIYTGGTTGMPRGVMWQHKDVFQAGLQGGNPGGEKFKDPAEVARTIRDEERGPMSIHPAAPLIHGAAQLASWIAMLTGGKVGLVEGRSFDPIKTLDLINDEGFNVVNLVGDAMAGPLANALEAEPERWNTETLVALSSAGAILSASIRDKLTKHLEHTMILNNFGSSETGHQGTAFYDDDDPDAKPMWFMDPETTVVLDEDRQLIEAGSGKRGWLARRGHLPQGYYKDPVKTAATFVEVDGVRYVIPGDMVTPEADGTLTFHGRGSICINTGGEKVFPEEVEEALKGHDAVEDAIVVGIPDDRWGQLVTALVKLNDGAEAAPEALETFARTRVAGYKVPRRLHVVDDLSRQPSGKPDYRWAREMSIRLSAEQDSAQLTENKETT
ncbi:MAG: acyl-CoA synthetase (AMP-forming)/AMP-acid ligase II [Myxococcota bacterium]